jgi:hypothetical protein
MDYLDALIASDLLSLMRGEERWSGSLDDLLACAAKRLGIGSRNRKRFWLAVERMRARGLLFEAEDHVHLLYSETAFREYKGLAPDTHQMVAKIAPRAVPTAQSVSSQRAVSEHSASTQTELSSGIYSIPIAREREREEKREKPPTGVKSPPVRVPRKPDARKPLWGRLLADAAKRHGFIAEKLLTSKQTADVIAKASAHADAAGVPLEAAMVRLLDEGHRRYQDEGKELKWCLVDWQPGAPPRRRWGKPKLEIAPCSPAEEFGTEEEALEKLRRRELEVAADLARRGVRRVGT